MYRRAALPTVGRTLLSLKIDDHIVVSQPEELQLHVGSKVTGYSRLGKVLTLHLDDGSIDLHFGMSGRIVIDGKSPIDELVYGVSSNDRWIRFGMYFEVGFLEISDPRRFARVGPSTRQRRLGPDAFGINEENFVDLVSGKKGKIKAVLLDQSVIAGLGNMLVDEILMRSRVRPAAPVSTLSREILSRIGAQIPQVLTQLLDRGGSHTGDLAASLRVPGARCPYDGNQLQRENVGGRTSYFCPLHQT